MSFIRVKGYIMKWCKFMYFCFISNSINKHQQRIKIENSIIVEHNALQDNRNHEIVMDFKFYTDL